MRFLPGKDYRSFKKGESDHERGEQRGQGSGEGLTVEILGAIGITAQEMESTFGEGSAGAAIELRLTQFAGAILEQAKPRPAPRAHPRAFGEVG